MNKFRFSRITIACFELMRQLREDAYKRAHRG